MVHCHLGRNTSVTAVAEAVAKERKGCFECFEQMGNGPATGDSCPGVLSRFR